MEEEITRQIINEKVIAQNNSFLNHTIWIIFLFVFFRVCFNTCMTIFGRKIKVIARIITFHFRKWTQWNHYLCMRLKNRSIFRNSIDPSWDHFTKVLQFGVNSLKYIFPDSYYKTISKGERTFESTVLIVATVVVAVFAAYVNRSNLFSHNALITVREQ